MDVGAWLRGLGLGQYEPAFRNNDVDAEVLPELAEADLERLGVASLGHRKRLLKAIATLQADTMPPLGRHVPGRPATGGERRQLTVMFVDLVGSTALSTRLDPEEMGDVLRAFQDAVAGSAARFDGQVARFMGDGVLCYFGWPEAHEDDAERAVRAGLAITAAVAKLRALGGEPLACRIGIATGRVMVGELIGRGAAAEEAVVGETPNLAARLQGLAEPGAVIIAEATRRLLGGLFAFRDLGATILKGFAGPVRAYRVLGEGTAEGRFEALRAAGLTPLVGREHELALLLDRWARAAAGEGQAVLLSGEPGIGKSRLVQALRERVVAERHTRLLYQCSPYHAGSALHPVVVQLERAADFARDDGAEARLDKLRAFLGATVEDLALIADFLGVPMDDDRLAGMAPQERRARTFKALVAQLEGLAASAPVLAVLEDAHWIDPTTEEMFDLVVERLQHLPVLLVVTFRPEHQPRWTGHSHATLLTLSRLGGAAAAAIARRTAGKDLPKPVLAEITRKTDGVPLFVEELTKAVVESGLLRDDGRGYALAGALPPLAIPATLHDSLLARLDRLSPSKEVAQVGAAIGREFGHGLLAAVTGMAEERLAAAVDDLLAAELVFRRGLPPDATYVFKHALVQDAAYGTLLKSRRQQLHARIAEAIEQHFPHTVESEPEIVAHHCAEAGLAERAVDYWRQAGRRALARSAAPEAAAQLAKSLEALRTLPDGPERCRREAELQVLLGQALIGAKGFGAPETGRAYARACQLCRKLGDVPELFPALYGRSVHHLVRGELAVAHEVARELLRSAEDRGDAAARVTGHRMVGAALCQLGRLAESRDHLEAALTLYDPARDRTSALVYAIDSRVVCLSWLSLVLVVLGYPEQALAQNGEALAYARELAHSSTTAVALAPMSCVLHQLLRDRRNAREQAEAAIALAREQGLPHYLAAGTIVRGWTLADAGRAEEGIAEIRRGLADYGATGAEMWSPYFQGLLAEVQGRAGRASVGLDLASEAVDQAERMAAHWIEADLHRLRGELLLALPEAERSAAEACFLRALAVAREQGARLWELRAATSLARLWRDQGRSGEAREPLARAYGWFTEGFEMPNLQEAKTLLDELASVAPGSLGMLQRSLGRE